MLRIVDIVEGTTVDGPGLRTSIYFAGCRHHCPGCHNPQTWDFDAGNPMSVSEIMDIVIRNGFNVTFTGGDPLYLLNSGIVDLAAHIKQLRKNIWCYTGFCWEELIEKPDFLRLKSFIDVLVDGPYIEAERDLSLRFRGSRNQRLIDCHKSSRAQIVLYSDSL